MAIRFNRRLRIAPGLTLNLGKRGVSTTVGVTGAKITAGTSGVRRTIGLPGTGLSDTELLRPPAAESEGDQTPAAESEADQPPAHETEHLSFGTVVLLLAVALALLAFRFLLKK